MPYLIVFCQGLLAVTFAVSAGGKVRSRAAYTAFRQSLARTGLIAPRGARLAAGVVTAAEVAVVPALVIPAFTLVGLAAAALLMTVLTVAVGVMIRRGVSEPCRCFGAGQRPPGAPHLVRNVVLLVVAGAGLGLAVAGGGPSAAPAAAVLAGVGGATLAFLLINLEEMVALLGPAPSVRQGSESSGSN